MARGINKTILVGNLGADPEVRQLTDGSTVANIRVAVTESWKDKESGERKEYTEWVNVSFFGKLAEIVEQYLTKGQQVYIEGKLRTRKWEDSDGNTRYSTEVKADDMVMLGGPKGEDAPAQAVPAAKPAAKKAAPVEVAPAETKTKVPAKKKTAAKKAAPVAEEQPEDDNEGFDSDIPF